MPSVFTAADDSDYVSMSRPGCMDTWEEGEKIISMYYNKGKMITQRTTELDVWCAMLQRALDAHEKNVESNVLNKVMNGDVKMYRRSPYVVNEHKRAAMINCMSGKENSPLPNLVSGLIRVATGSNLGTTHPITVHVTVIGMHMQTFDVCISSCSIAAQLSDICIARLCTGKTVSIKLFLDEQGTVLLRDEDTLTNQGVRDHHQLFAKAEEPKIKNTQLIYQNAAFNTRGSKAMHFIKMYRGTHKMECHNAEAQFFNTLKEKETIKGCSSRRGSECIIRPIIMLRNDFMKYSITITPLCPCGDAFDVFTKDAVPFKTHIAIWNDIGSAIRHLYDLKLQHGDVKLENIMFYVCGSGNPHFALTDCEYSGTPGTDLERRTGTPNYASPERVANPPKYDEKCDGWSFAVTIFSAWGQRKLQDTSASAFSETGRCRAYFDSCEHCGISLILDDKGEHTVCACRSMAACNQMLLNQTIADAIAKSFERFSIELGEELDTEFVMCKGAENACGLIIWTLQGLLSIEPTLRLGPDSISLLN